MKALAGLLALLALTVTTPPVEAATSINDIEHNLMDLVNDARKDRGLKPLRVSGRLWSIAGYRAGRMASTNVLSHSVAGSISSQLRNRHMPWYAYGEDIGYTRAQRGSPAIKDLFRMWKNSPSHLKLILSNRYNYLGVGIAYRGSKTFSSLIFTESPDLTNPRATMVERSVSGDDVTWSWQGVDPVLQTHTAGLRSFDVQRRTSLGTWTTIIKGTLATTARWMNLPGGRSYAMRVRAKDRAGNVGSWTPALWVRIP